MPTPENWTKQEYDTFIKQIRNYNRRLTARRNRFINTPENFLLQYLPEPTSPQQLLSKYSKAEAKTIAQSYQEMRGSDFDLTVLSGQIMTKGERRMIEKHVEEENARRRKIAEYTERRRRETHTDTGRLPVQEDIDVQEITAESLSKKQIERYKRPDVNYVIDERTTRWHSKYLELLNRNLGLIRYYADIKLLEKHTVAEAEQLTRDIIRIVQSVTPETFYYAQRTFPAELDISTISDVPTYLIALDEMHNTWLTVEEQERNSQGEGETS